LTALDAKDAAKEAANDSMAATSPINPLERRKIRLPSSGVAASPNGSLNGRARSAHGISESDFCARHYDFYRAGSGNLNSQDKWNFCLTSA
jgi:hypothetical protein